MKLLAKVYTLHLVTQNCLHYSLAVTSSRYFNKETGYLFHHQYIFRSFQRITKQPTGPKLHDLMNSILEGYHNLTQLTVPRKQHIKNGAFTNTYTEDNRTFSCSYHGPYPCPYLYHDDDPSLDLCLVTCSCVFYQNQVITNWISNTDNSIIK